MTTTAVDTRPGPDNLSGITKARLEAFSDGDPFTQAGVFASVKITRMRKGQFNPQAAEGA